MSDSEYVTIAQILDSFIRNEGNVSAVSTQLEIDRGSIRRALTDYELDSTELRDAILDVATNVDTEELVSVITAMVANDGNMISAAKSLDTTRGTIRAALERYKLDPDRFRNESGSPAETVRTKKNRQLQQMLRDEQTAHEQTAEKLRLLEAIEGFESDPPAWLTDVRGLDNEVTHTAMLSDIHYTETVDPSEVMGKNVYNSEIAATRMERFFSEIIVKGHHVFSGMSCDRLVLPILGDIMSGMIHAELDATNDQEIIDAVFAVADLIIAGIEAVSPYYNDIYVPCVVGNHGRMDKKPRAKKAVGRNFDYAVYKAVARYFRNTDSVTVHAPPSLFTTWDVYSETHLAMHGDSMRGGSGTIGAIYPILRGHLRHSKQFSSMDVHYDRLLIGHWHSQHNGINGVHVNGCFPAGSLVSTPSGPRAIESMSVGDPIYCGEGKVERVNHCFTKSNDRLVHLHVRGLPLELSATPNHQIYAIKGEATKPVAPSRRHLIGGSDKPQWIPADFISAGDWVGVTRPETTGERPFPRDLAWLYGLFLAEGSTVVGGGAHGRANRMGLSMHREEVHHLQEAAAIIAKHFPEWNEAIISLPTNHPNSAELVVNGKAPASHFRDLLGYKSWGKKVPSNFLTMAPDLQAAVVEGWLLGDGHTRRDGVTSGTTTSPDLAWSMFYMGFHTGAFPSVRRLRAGGPRKRDTFTVHFNQGQEARIEGGEVFYRVENRFSTDNDEPVYDLEVSGSHTYVVNNVHVHNSVKGWDEYSMRSQFEYQPPMQCFFVNSPEGGCIATADIYCDPEQQPGV